MLTSDESPWILDFGIYSSGGDCDPVESVRRGYRWRLFDLPQAADIVQFPEIVNAQSGRKMPSFRQQSQWLREVRQRIPLCPS